MRIHQSFVKYLKEKKSEEKRFVVDEKNHKFYVILDDILLAESGFKIENPDEWFNGKYISIYDLKTIEKYRGKGFARYLLEKIFEYTKNILEFNIVTLIVDKDNYKAIKLYFNMGFEIFMEYDESYSLVKKL